MSSQFALAEVGSMESTGPYLAPARGPSSDEPKDIKLVPLSRGSSPRDTSSRYTSVYSSQGDTAMSVPQSPPETQMPHETPLPQETLLPPQSPLPPLQHETQIPHETVLPPETPPAVLEIIPHVDPKVQPALHTEPAVPKDASAQRRLLRPSTNSSRSNSLSLASRKKDRNSERRLLPSIPMSTTVTTIGGMSLVIGLFLISIWLVKRGMPKSNTVLPEDVVSLLGRRQLSAKQSMQMLRVGNKLVLISVTPDGTEPITEVTDPAEVDRILGLCQQSHGHSSTAEFQHVLDQLTRQSNGQGLFSANTHSSGAHVPGAHATGSDFG